MSLWSKVRGTIESYFQIGLGGPQIKRSTDALEIRNAADNGYAVLRVGAPVGQSDAATRKYVDTVATPSIVTAQHDGGDALPNNSGTPHFIVVSTTGGVASIGELLWDNGLTDGQPVTKLAASARMIVTTQALNGGTVTFLADSIYVWDTDASSWVLASPAALSGAIREIRFTVGTATTDSTAKIPANARVTETSFEVTTPYQAGTTISIGQAGDTAILQATSDNNPLAGGTYLVPQDVAWGVAELAVKATVAGGPGFGAGVCVVKYSVPNA